VLPALYIVGASVVMVVLLFYKTQTTWPGLLIVLAGVPVYFLWVRWTGKGVVADAEGDKNKAKF
jgi:basic amino acid/polyamine antiporter, APA family